MALPTSLDLPGMPTMPPTMSVSCFLRKVEGQHAERSSLRSMSVPIRRRGERSSSLDTFRSSKSSTPALTEPCFTISETETWLQEDRARQETATSLSRQSSSCSFSNCFDAFGLDDVGDLHSDSIDTAVMKDGHLERSLSIVPQPRDERAARPSSFGKTLSGLKNAALSAVCSTSHRRRGRAATQPADARARPSCAPLRVATRPTRVHAWEVPGEQHSNASSSTAAFVVGQTGRRSRTLRTKAKSRHHHYQTAPTMRAQAWEAWANGWS